MSTNKDHHLLIGIPVDVLETARALVTQDNRATAIPVFVVESKEWNIGLREDYAEEMVRINDEDPDIDPDDEMRELLDAYHAQTGKKNWKSWEMIGRRPYWRFRGAFFTEQAAKDYIRQDGHNIGEHRIYVYSGYRNDEWDAIRTLLRRIWALHDHTQLCEGTSAPGSPLAQDAASLCDSRSTVGQAITEGKPEPEPEKDALPDVERK